MESRPKKSHGNREVPFFLLSFFFFSLLSSFFLFIPRPAPNEVVTFDFLTFSRKQRETGCRRLESRAQAGGDAGGRDFGLPFPACSSHCSPVNSRDPRGGSSLFAGSMFGSLHATKGQPYVLGEVVISAERRAQSPSDRIANQAKPS